MIRYAQETVDGTTWPIDWSDDNEDSTQWILRYGSPERRESQRMSAASILACYAHLLDPNLTMKDATAALRRARAASVRAWEKSDPEYRE